MDRLNRIARVFAHSAAALLIFSALAYATTFNNGASGASVRALLNRLLLMQYNVQDYGAVGNGSADDTVAIQAAITAAISAGGGTVYFPALAGSSNCYKTSSPITFTAGTGSGTRLVTLKGEKGVDTNGSRVCGNFGGASTNVTGAAAAPGTGWVRLAVVDASPFHTDATGGSSSNSGNSFVYISGIVGTTEGNCLSCSIRYVDATHVDMTGIPFVHAYTSGGAVQAPGYVFDAPDTGGNDNFTAITGLYIDNPHAAGAGVRMTDVTTGEISECRISAGLVGAYLASSTYNINVRSCVFDGYSNVGVGLFATQQMVMSSSFTGWAVGIMAWNVGLGVIGNRFEVNSTAIILGRDETGTTNGIGDVVVSGNSGEKNDISMVVVSATGLSVSGTGFSGTVGPDNVTPPHYGIIVQNCTGCSFSGVGLAVSASVAGIDVSNISGERISFASVSGGSWLLPTGGSSILSFTNSDNPTAAMLFANLPASPVEGMQFDVTNCTIAGGVWGGVVTGGGTTHCHVRRNASAWTAMGM